jgi:Tfp pilus assembly protein PilN
VRPVNLIPDERRRRSGTGRSGSAYVVLGVLGALLVMAVAYVLTSNHVNDRKTQAAEARQEADGLEAQANTLNSFSDFSMVKQTRLAAVRGVAYTRFDWERFMRELSLVVPSGSWLQSADASVTGPADATAGAATPSGTETTATAALPSPSATLVGCTQKQSEVASMMVRLRQLYRVTEVSLNESAQEQAGAQATLDNCGKLYKFDVTVTFSPAPLRQEAPPGATRVPASLGGGS